MPTCCCMWSMPPTRNHQEQMRKYSACWLRSVREIGPQVLVFNKLDAVEMGRARRRSSARQL
jgi:hypothetical protein